MKVIVWINPSILPREYPVTRVLFAELALIKTCNAAPDPKLVGEFVKILMLHRDYPSTLVTEAVEMAMTYSYDGVLDILGQIFVSGNPRLVPVSEENPKLL